MRRGIARGGAWLLTLGLLAPVAGARADLLSAINDLRANGCGAKQARIAPLRNNAQLDATARGLANASTMQAAMAQAGYRGVKSLSIRLSGAPNDAAVAGYLQQRHCAEIANSSFRDIGIHRDAAGVWIVLGSPLTLPAASEAPQIARKVLELVNQARATPRSCGTTSFPAAPPLKANALLVKAAQLHAKDMAEGSHFSHTGRDGSTASARVTRVGYAWQMTSENIAAGAGSAEETVAGWLRSPPHCANLMEARYTEHGVAFAVSEKSKMGIYWAEVFGRPQ
jgi:uncharacterized protein YkwD